MLESVSPKLSTCHILKNYRCIFDPEKLVSARIEVPKIIIPVFGRACASCLRTKSTSETDKSRLVKLPKCQIVEAEFKKTQVLEANLD